NSVRKSARHFDAALRFVLLVLEFFAASVRAGQQFLETAILFLVLVIGQRLVLKRDDAIGAALAGLNDVARLWAPALLPALLKSGEVGMFQRAYLVRCTTL